MCGISSPSHATLSCLLSGSQQTFRAFVVFFLFFLEYQSNLRNEKEGLKINRLRIIPLDFMHCHDGILGPIFAIHLVRQGEVYPFYVNSSLYIFGNTLF